MRQQKTLENVDNISFVIETMRVRDGHTLKTLDRDNEGYYLNIPMAVLGIVTQNNTYYQVDRFVQELQSQESLFNKTLAEGKLYGEYGHPGELASLGKEAGLKRLLTVEPKNLSHHIKRVSTGRKLETGGVVVEADVKPTGPHGSHLKESLDTPSMNTSFSLRSAAKSQTKNGVIHRSVLRMVTFDYVCAGGYNEASKRYASVKSGNPANEEYIDVVPTPGKGVLMDYVAFEHVNDTEINDILGAKEIVKERRVATYYPTTDQVRYNDTDTLVTGYLDFIRRG